MENMKGNFLKMKCKAKGQWSGVMVIYTKEHLQRDIKKEEGKSNMEMGIIMKEILRKIWCMAKEFINGKVEKYTKVNFRRGKWLEKGR